MSFYSDASVVMIPSGYKTSKVYCAVPTDGAADLVFSRSNDTATRVGPDGLIEKVRTNVLTYSQTFSDASWLIGTGQTKTQGQTDPNGGTTAVLISNVSEANGYMSKALTLTANVPNTFSIYIKGSSSGSVSLRLDDSTAGPQFDINYTTSWQRFSVTRTVNQASCFLTVGGYSTWAIGENIQFAFAQVETGDIATAYIATTTAAVSVGPVANVPRLDYLGSSCPRLLLEPQRQNLALNSESFNSSSYSKVRATITANAITSPDGYTNADKMESTAGATLAVECYQTITTTAQTYTASAFFKQGSGANDLNHLDVYYLGTGTYNASVKINLSTGVLTQTIGTGASVVNYGNGWYRVLVPFTATAGSTAFYFGSDGAHYASGSFVYLYGAQVEAGAYATSYIPTLGAAVTRGADACSKTGISSLIGQAEGVLFVDFVAEQPSEVRRITLSDGTSANRILIGHQADGTIQFFIAVGSASQVSFNTSASYTKGTRLKIAFAYKANDFAAYINGAQVLTDNSGTVPASSKFAFADAIDTNPLISSVNQALLFKTRLNNSELAQLTTI